MRVTQTGDIVQDVPNGAENGWSDQVWYICIDAGGTKCAAAIANAAGEVMGRGYAGSSNMTEMGLRRAFHRIRQATLDALQEVYLKSKERSAPSPTATCSSSSSPEAEPAHSNLPRYLMRTEQQMLTPAASTAPSPSASSVDLNSMGKTNGTDELTGCSGSFVGRCPIDFAAVWVGIAGCDSERDERRMGAVLTEYFGRPVKALNDALLLSSPIIANGSPWGIDVVSGTGSVVVGVEIDSEGLPTPFGRRGGHGSAIGDEGSAYHVGKRAVAAVADDFNCGISRCRGLTKRLCEYFGAENAGDLSAKAHDVDETETPTEAMNNRKLRLAHVAPMVTEAASEGDELAIEILQDCAAQLCVDIVKLARVYAQRHGRTYEDLGDEATLCLGGGLVRQEVYRKIIVETLRSAGLTFKSVDFVNDAAGKGAATLALQHR